MSELTPARSRHNLVVLSIALILTAAALWQLRQPSAKNALWPWVMLVAGMMGVAFGLNRLEGWLPRTLIILPQPSAITTKRQPIFGVICIGRAPGLTGLIVLRLWPNYHQWEGTVTLWVIALILVLIGAWLIGAAGEVSPRAITAVRNWVDKARNRKAIFVRVFKPFRRRET